jgi:hypothetical protein
MDRLYVEVYELRTMIQEKILPKLIEVEASLQKQCNSKVSPREPYLDLDKYYQNYPRS